MRWISRPFPLLIGLSLVTAPALVPALTVPARAQANPAPDQPPREAIITAVRDRDITLGIGTNEGAVRGAVYGVARGGRIRARVQVLEVRADESTATILSADEDFVLAVGDAGQFIAVQDVQAPPTTITPVPATPPATTIEPTTPGTPAPTTVLPGSTPPVTTTVETPLPVATTPGTSATITSVNGEQVTLDVGTLQGARAGQKVPVVRNGDVVALVRLQTVTESTASGDIIWRDEMAGGLLVGDAVSLAPGSGTPTPTTVINVDAPQRAVPAAPMRYETRASNAVVPRADETYKYLAALAAKGLITSQPAHIFHDEGVGRHRTEEDLTFSRSQVAGFIREALEKSGGSIDELPGGATAALIALTVDYERELKAQGVEESTLRALRANRGFVFGISGQNRASLVGGSAQNGGNEPFSERQGGRRTRSGFDNQTNIFGQSGENLRFFGRVDTRSKSQRGSNDDGFDLETAFVQWQANKLLRGLTLKAGRDDLWLGPGHFGTLLLSDAAGPLNLLHASFKRGSYELQGFYAPLDRGPLGGRRSLYGHNLHVQIGPQLRVGVAETLLLPQDRLDPVAFVNAFLPVPLFMVERARNRNLAAENGNSLVQFYIESSLARGVRSWAEFLMDDVGVNQNNLVRNRFGTLLGMHFFTPRDPAKLGLFAEYANLQGRTYLGLRALNDADYYYRGTPLGYPVASPANQPLGGAESLRLEAYWRPTRKLRVGGGIEFADLASEQTNRARQQVYRLRAGYDLTRNLSIIGRLQRVSTSQANFVLGAPAVRQYLYQLEIAHSF